MFSGPNKANLSPEGALPSQRRDLLRTWVGPDCQVTPTSTPTNTPIPTATPTNTPQPTPTPVPTSTPQPTDTLTPSPTPLPTPTPTRQKVCNPGEWTGCGGRPPAVVCDPEYVSRCQPDGTRGPCRWDPTTCGPKPPPSQPSGPCVCGDGDCYDADPCYEGVTSSPYYCPADCGECGGAPPTSCNPNTDDPVECAAGGGSWICGIASCFCLCP